MAPPSQRVPLPYVSVPPSPNLNLATVEESLRGQVHSRLNIIDDRLQISTVPSRNLENLLEINELTRRVERIEIFLNQEDQRKEEKIQFDLIQREAFQVIETRPISGLANWNGKFSERRG